MKIVKPDEVYLDHDPSWGWVFMNKAWEVVAILDNEGNIFVRGLLQPKYDFMPPELDENGNIIQGVGGYGKAGQYEN